LLSKIALFQQEEDGFTPPSLLLRTKGFALFAITKLFFKAAGVNLDWGINYMDSFRELEI